MIPDTWGFDQWTRGLLWTEVYVQMKGSTFEMPIFGTWTKATALRWLFCIQDTPLKMRWTCFWIRISAKSVLDFLRAQFSRLVLPNRPGWEWKKTWYLLGALGSAVSLRNFVVILETSTTWRCWITDPLFFWMPLWYICTVYIYIYTLYTVIFNRVFALRGISFQNLQDFLWQCVLKLMMETWHWRQPPTRA